MIYHRRISEPSKTGYHWSESHPSNPTTKNRLTPPPVGWALRAVPRSWLNWKWLTDHTSRVTNSAVWLDSNNGSQVGEVEGEGEWWESRKIGFSDPFFSPEKKTSFQITLWERRIHQHHLRRKINLLNLHFCWFHVSLRGSTSPYGIDCNKYQHHFQWLHTSNRWPATIHGALRCSPPSSPLVRRTLLCICL